MLLWERLSVCSLPGRHRHRPRRISAMGMLHGTNTELQPPALEVCTFKETWPRPIGFSLTTGFLLGFDYIPHLKKKTP